MTWHGRIVQIEERAPQSTIGRVARESELRELGESPLTKRNTVLRIAARGKGQIRKRGEKRCGECFLKSLKQRRRHVGVHALRHRHEIPQATMREEMVVL